MAQSVKCPTLAQVMVSRSVSSSPALNSCVILCLPLSLKINRGAWVVQSVKCPTLAQVMNSQFGSSSPAAGSVLTVQSLEPALDSASPPLSVPPLLVLYLLKINKTLKKMQVGM